MTRRVFPTALTGTSVRAKLDQVCVPPVFIQPRGAAPVVFCSRCSPLPQRITSGLVKPWQKNWRGLWTRLVSHVFKFQTNPMAYGFPTSKNPVLSPKVTLARAATVFFRLHACDKAKLFS